MTAGSGFENVQFSMRGKYEDPLSKHGNELGPGQYPSHGEINKTGSFFNSKYNSSACGKIAKTDRFPY